MLQLFRRCLSGNHPSKKSPQHRPRLTTCRLGAECLEDRLALSPYISIDYNAWAVEGNSGTRNAAVMVRLSEPAPRQGVTVDYRTGDASNGGATAGSDYVPVSGKLSFDQGETAKPILVPVIGDRLPETDEGIWVVLANARGAVMNNPQGLLIITEDEPRISISGVSDYEGDVGSKYFEFTVSLRVAYDQAVTVNYATADIGSATAGLDYVATNGTITFAPGETTKTIRVEVLGDVLPENDEYFAVQLSGASANATIVQAWGTGWIRNDDLDAVWHLVNDTDPCSVIGCAPG